MLDTYQRTSGLTKIFKLIQKSFTEVFPNTSFEILSKESRDPKHPDKENYIQITEWIDSQSLSYPLKDTASGYFETIGIFTALVIGQGNAIFLDEPALHLHPTKIKYFGRTLMKMSEKQVTIITHSPYFVELGLFSPGRNLVSVKKNGLLSHLATKTRGFTCEVTPSLFRPEIFFAKFIILVEGAGDAAVFTSISDIFDSILEKEDIFILAPEGNGNVNNYWLLLNEYKIDFLAMVDNPYPYIKNEKIHILDGKLESELEKLGWNNNTKQSIDPEEAYNFIFGLMQTPDGKNKIKNSIFGALFIQAIKNVSGNNPFT